MSIAEGAVIDSLTHRIRNWAARPHFCQRVEDNAFHLWNADCQRRRLRARSHRDDFPQHPQAIAKKTDFASFSVVPADRNFPNAQPSAMREKKQLNIERKTIHMRRLQNRPANIELKGLEPALGVPKWQTGCNAHKEIENTTPLLAPPRLMDSD